MMNILKFIILIIKSLFHNAFIAGVLSGIYAFFHWICSLLSWCNPPTWNRFIGCALLWFILFEVYHMYNFVLTFYRYSKYPDFEHFNTVVGLSWEEYKKFKEEKEEKKKMQKE